MAYGTVNADVIGTSVANTSLGAGNASIMKNRIINGAMVIDQRNNGAAITPSSNAFCPDRFAYDASVGSKMTIQQVSDAPAGFVNSVKYTVASQYSPAASDSFLVQHGIEGFNIADLGWGTANAKTITFSFWVKASVAGTYGIGLDSSDNGVQYVQTYNATTSWTQVSITVPGPTTGTFNTNNTAGLFVQFDLGSGTNFNGTAGVWQSGAQLRRTSGCVTFVNQAVNSTLQITGVQLEVGSSATGFEYRQYQQELALCQRYYQLNQVGTALDVTSGATYGGNCYYGTQMRVSATVVWINSTAAFRFPTTAPSIQVATSQGFQFYKAANGSGATGSYTDLISSSAEL